MNVGIILEGQTRWSRVNRKSNVNGTLDALQRIFDWMYTCPQDLTSITFKDSDNKGLMDQKYFDVHQKSLRKLIGFFEKNRDMLMDAGWNVRVLGYLNTIEPKLKKVLMDLESRNRPENHRCLQLCVNYSGQNEILRAMKLAHRRELSLTHENFEHCLDSTIDIDLIVRTGGKHNLDNFLSWQTTDSIIYFSDKLWPEIQSSDIEEAMRFYSKEKNS